MSNNPSQTPNPEVVTSDEPTEKKLLEIVGKWLEESGVTDVSAKEALKDRDLREWTRKKWDEIEGQRRRQEREKAERQREFEERRKKNAGLERLKTFARNQVFGKQKTLPSPVELLIKAGSAGTLPSTILAEENGKENDLNEEVKKKFNVTLPFAVYGDQEHANAARWFFIRCIKNVQEKLRVDQIAPEDRKNMEVYKQTLQRHINAVNFVLDAGHDVKYPRTLPWARQEISDYMDKVCVEIMAKFLFVAAEKRDEKKAMRIKFEADEKAREEEAQEVNRLAALKFLQNGNRGLSSGVLEDGAKLIAKAMKRKPKLLLKEAAFVVLQARVNEVVQLPLDKEDRVAAGKSIVMSYARSLGVPMVEIEKTINSRRSEIAQQAERQRAVSNAVSSQPMHIGAMEGSGGGKNKPTGEKKPRTKGHGKRK